jgi:hypothetical protein
MLGALPANEDPIPIPEEGGHPPPFDFFWSGSTRFASLSAKSQYQCGVDQLGQSASATTYGGGSRG